VTDEDNPFAGLMTMSNTIPTKSAKLTIDDLINAVEEFPKYVDEQMAKHEEFILNQDRWQHVILTERPPGKSERMKQLLMNMRLGVPCSIPLSTYPYCIMDEIGKPPRFMWLRKRLFKLTIGAK
jgi:hypothetical protein